MVLRKIVFKKIDCISINETEFFIIRKYFKTNAKRVNLQYPNHVQPENQKNEIVLLYSRKNSKIKDNLYAYMKELFL